MLRSLLTHVARVVGAVRRAPDPLAAVFARLERSGSAGPHTIASVGVPGRHYRVHAVPKAVVRARTPEAVHRIAVCGAGAEGAVVYLNGHQGADTAWVADFLASARAHFANPPPRP